GHPADVRRAPVNVFVLEIEHPLGGDVSPDRIATGRVNYPLRLPGAARCVEDVERMLGVERLCLAVARCSGHQLVPPMIAVPLHPDFRTGALVDDDRLYRRT